MNLDLLRDEDKLYAAEVVQYLTAKGLRVELGGGAARGDKQYDDIDLLVRGTPQQIADAYRGLIKRAGSKNSFPEEAAYGLEYRVELLGTETRYFHTTVDERVTIEVGETTIDVSFKSN